MTHGGKREGAGRPPKNMSVRRIYKLSDQGLTTREVAKLFEVSHMTINRILKKRNVKL